MGFIRVRNKKTGAEYSVSDRIALGDDVEKLDKGAADESGRPLPTKHKTTVGGPAPEDSTVVEIPGGVPDETWTVKQIDAYAEREGIDLGDASNKAEKLSAVIPNEE